MGLMDIFSDDPAENAAESKKRGLNAAFDSASRYIGVGLDAAKTGGWTVVSVKHDWATVFADAPA